MDFSALTPAPEPPAPGPGVPVLDGPGSQTPQSLTRGLSSLPEADRDAPALVVATSGSTGTPKRTLLTAGSLRASGRATAETTDSDGAQWLLALPVHYVAGAQVIARSMLAGTTPVTTASLAPGTGFTAGDFLAAVERMTHPRRMTALVPTQLHVLLEAAESGVVPADQLHEALRSFRAILLGGAPASASLRARIRELGLPVVTTYGSAETAGGCVYDGRALPGVEVRIEPTTTAGGPATEDGPDSHGPGSAPGTPVSAAPGVLDGSSPSAVDEGPAGGPGRIWLGGPTVAAGYLEDPARHTEHFRVDAHGTRWYRTDDLGTLEDITSLAGSRPGTESGSPTGSGPGPGPRPETGSRSASRPTDHSDAPRPEHLAGQRLRVAGRADDVIITGGIKVSARAVAAALEEVRGVREALVVGVPHPRWGQAVAAMVAVPGLSGTTPSAPAHPADAHEDPDARGNADARETAELEDRLRAAVRERLGPRRGAEAPGGGARPAADLDRQTGPGRRRPRPRRAPPPPRVRHHPRRPE
ncbi:AMP-binding protein [Rothia kristinae]|uniref:AMP-binding protein n=1 Tax=Rothia kristinae TaxID=37923 RepID=UPI001E5F864D